MSQGFRQSHLQAAFIKFYGRYNNLNLPIQFFVGPHAVWYVSYQSLIVLDTLILTTVRTIYLTWKWGSGQVWLVDWGCLLLHGTWSHGGYMQRSMYAHSLICIFYRTNEISVISCISLIIVQYSGGSLNRTLCFPGKSFQLMKRLDVWIT
jgi:hypothetical protein